MAGNIGVSDTPKTYKSWANGYKALIDTAFTKGRDYRAGICYMDSTDNWEDRIVELGGIDDFQVWDAGDRASQTQIKEGYEKKFTQLRFGKEVPIGTIAKKFQGNNVNLTKRAATELGNRAYRLQQNSVFSLLGYAFSDTNTYLTGIKGSTISALLPDGKRLASTLRPCSPTNSTTWSNALSDNAAVGETALEDMIINLNDQLDDQGEKMFLGDSGYLWVVPLNKFAEASRVVGSERRSGTTDNDTNVFNGDFDGRPIEVRWVPFLSAWSTTAHFLLAKDAVERYMPLVNLTSLPFYTDDYVDDSTDTAYVRGRCIQDVGSVSGRGIVCSQGTGTGTYSA